MKRFITYILLCFALFANHSKSQSVGVVLSGGGAKGLAHIGVLRALEENNIPIDYIAGTSMGAIIGGLYASGFTVDSIEKIFLSKDLNEWLNLSIPNKHLLYYKQNKDDATMLGIGLDMNNKFKAEIPLSLINPTQIDFAFMQYFAKANEICKSDYSKLMIPFLCVASDITDKCQSVQMSGDLGKSIRASMTFPFVFSPITIDNHLMCDGGVYNNFPSEEMIKYFHPDVLIGVKVVDNYDTPNEEDLLLYVENIITVDSKFYMPDSNGVLISPKTKQIGIMDFNLSKESIKAGYNATNEKIKDIKKLVHKTISMDERAEQREYFLSQGKEVKIANIDVSGVNKRKQNYITKFLTSGKKNDAISLDDIKERYLNLASMPEITSLQSSIYYDNFINNYVLHLNVKKKDILKANIGGMISTDPISNLFLGFEYNFFNRTAYKISTNVYFGRYYKSATICFRADFLGNILPFYVEGETAINNWNFFRNRNGLFEYSATNYLVQNEKNLQVRLVFPTSKKSFIALKAGIGRQNDEYFNSDAILSTDTTDQTTFKNFVLGICSETNMLDDKLFSTEGLFFKFNIQYIHGKEQFYEGNASSYNIDDTIQNHSWLQFDAKVKFFQHISKRYSAGVMARGFYSLQNLFLTKRSSLLNAGIFYPTLETFTRFYDEYRANQFAAIGLEQSIILGRNFLGDISLRFSLYNYIPIKRILSNDYNQPYYSKVLDKTYTVGALTFLIKTHFGNLALTGSYTQRDNGLSPWNVSLSFGKIIFNNRNIER